MNGKRIFNAIVIAVVLGVVLGGATFGQSVAPTASGAEPQSAQQTFRITPMRPISELRAEALKAKPPEEPGPLSPWRAVDLAQADSSIHLELRYATSNNFLGEPVYEHARAFLQEPAVAALMRVNARLYGDGYGLLVYDAYRPWYVTKIFWEATPADKREFVANPALGSSHNRGCAVDLALYDLKTGAAVSMPSEYGEMTPRAYSGYAGGTKEEKRHREILRKAMRNEGFVQKPNEWWHYDCKDWQKYQILNVPFDHFSDPSVTKSSLTGQIYHVGNGVSAPKILKRVNPTFSDDARLTRHFDGTLVLSLVIDEEGVPRDIQVTRSLGRGLDQQAIKAAQLWRFEPGKKDGKAVPVKVNMEVRFQLY